MAFEDVFIYSDNPDKFLDEVQRFGTEEDKKLFDPQTGLDKEILKTRLLNGVNNGSKTFAQWINDHNIRTPQTEDEIVDAKAGKFNQIDNTNQTPTLNTSAQKSPGLFDRFMAGYGENYYNPIQPSNFAKDPRKNWSYRLGEGLGTVGRFIDSPIGRGLIAAGLNKALGYDDSIVEGLRAVAGRQNAVTADKLYRKQLKDYGYTDDDLAQIRGNITSDVYKNLANNLYRNKKLTQDQAIKYINNIRQLQANRQIDNDTASQMIASVTQNTDLEGMDIAFQDSNQTRNTDSQIGYRNERLKQYDEQLALIDKKIAQSGANAQARIALENKKLNIKQEQKKEKEKINQEKAKDLSEFYQIYSGKDKGAKEYARNEYIKRYGEDPLKKLEIY